MSAKRAVTPRMSDGAVHAKTGKTWNEWFQTLDTAGARKLHHAAIASLLYEKHNLPGWWAQMVAVTYEQARGIRQVHEKPGGFEISSSKTLELPVAQVFAAWKNLKFRRRWLKDVDFVIRKATPCKSLHITWGDGKTSLDVNFYSKRRAKSQVIVQHGKLADAKDAERMKKYWGTQLEKLKDVFNGP